MQSFALPIKLPGKVILTVRNDVKPLWMNWFGPTVTLSGDYAIHVVDPMTLILKRGSRLKNAEFVISAVMDRPDVSIHDQLP